MNAYRAKSVLIGSLIGALVGCAGSVDGDGSGVGAGGGGVSVVGDGGTKDSSAEGAGMDAATAIRDAAADTSVPTVRDARTTAEGACTLPNGESCMVGTTCKEELVGASSPAPGVPEWCACNISSTSGEPECTSWYGGPDAAAAPCEVTCPKGMELDSQTCACTATPPPAGSCYLPNTGYCPSFEANYQNGCAPAATCPDGKPISCWCESSGVISCELCDDVADAGCFIPTVGICPINTSCAAGTCADGVTPVTCSCSGDSASDFSCSAECLH